MFVFVICFNKKISGHNEIKGGIFGAMSPVATGLVLWSGVVYHCLPLTSGVGELVEVSLSFESKDKVDT